MAKVRTIKEIVFDMMFEDMPLIDILAIYDDAAEKYGFPHFLFNVTKNITVEIDEEEYSSDDPLVTVINGKTISVSNIEFVSRYFAKAVRYILQDYDLYEEPDYLIFEQFIQKVIRNEKKLKLYKIDNIVEMVLDKDLNLMMDGNITTEMLLENILENKDKIDDYAEY